MAVSQWSSSSGVTIDGVTFNSGTIDTNGAANSIILDADGDTHISAPTANQIDFSIAGADDFTMTANAFNVLSGSQITGPSSTNVTFIPIAALENITAGTGGAISVTCWYTTINTDAGGDAFTLADGVIKGQLKKIQLIVDGGGDAVVTPTNLAAGTDITFADAGDFVILAWDGSDWRMIEAGNGADGVSSPTLA